MPKSKRRKKKRHEFHEVKRSDGARHLCRFKVRESGLYDIDNILSCGNIAR